MAEIAVHGHSIRVDGERVMPPVDDCPACAHEAILTGSATQVGGLAVWEWGAGFWALDADRPRRLNPDAEAILRLQAGRVVDARRAVPRR